MTDPIEQHYQEFPEEMMTQEELDAQRRAYLRDNGYTVEFDPRSHARWKRQNAAEILRKRYTATGCEACGESVPANQLVADRGRNDEVRGMLCRSCVYWVRMKWPRAEWAEREVMRLDSWMEAVPSYPKNILLRMREDAVRTAKYLAKYDRPLKAIDAVAPPAPEI